VGFSRLSLVALPVDVNGVGSVITNIVIDNVALEPVPEPTTLLLWATSAAGLGLARWRRRP
jgi:hypothetical protein